MNAFPIMSSGFVIGIDPGISGAIALLKDGEVIQCWDMPVSPKLSGKGNEVNAYLLSDAIKEALEIAGGSVECCCIERVSAGGAATGEGKRTMGATSAFGFGRSAGVIEGVLAVLNIKVKFANPGNWKKMFSLTGKEKDASRTLALQMWPDMSDRLKRKKDNGRSDAMLIGAYAASA